MDFTLSTYYPIILFLLVILGFAVSALLATHLVGPKQRTPVKQMPYESGMDPIGDARQRFDVKFYLIAILFLVFDVELLFLYPWAASPIRGERRRAGSFCRRVSEPGLLGSARVPGHGGGRLRLRLAERGVPMAVEACPTDVMVTQLDQLANWVRKNSLWPMPFATACCGIELMATGASRHDIARFGAEAMRFSPRQCDLMIVAGRVVMKMLPVLQRIWLQMPEPKWCISMGACASSRRRLRHLRRGAGHRSLHSGGRVRARLSAAAGAAVAVGDRSAGQDPAHRHHHAARSSQQRTQSWTRRREPLACEVPPERRRWSRRGELSPRPTRLRERLTGMERRVMTPRRHRRPSCASSSAPTASRRRSSATIAASIVPAERVYAVLEFLKRDVRFRHARRAGRRPTTCNIPMRRTATASGTSWSTRRPACG